MVRATMEPLMKQLSILLYAYKCDILVMAGRPTTIDAIPELFIKYYPMSPDRIICLNDYRVGTWYPFADGQGYFYDQKSVVAVGAMVGYMASTTGFNGMRIDFKEMIRRMKPTANFIGFYDDKTQQVKNRCFCPTSRMHRRPSGRSRYSSGASSLTRRSIRHVRSTGCISTASTTSRCASR